MGSVALARCCPSGHGPWLPLPFPSVILGALKAGRNQPWKSLEAGEGEQSPDTRAGRET